MKKFELVFIPLPASSHLTSAIEFAKRLVDQDETLSITFLMILMPNQTDLDPKTKSVAASHTRIRFIIIPPTTSDSLTGQVPSYTPISLEMFAKIFIESHKPQVEKAVIELASDGATQLVGFVLDMFCTSMVDIANKCMVPSYVIFTSNAAFLGFLSHLPVRHERVGGVEFYPSDPDSVIPSFKHPVPTNVLPGAVFDKTGGGYEAFLYLGTRIQECKGVIVNSFVELEPYAFDSVRGSPTVYAVGPLLEDKKECNSTGWIEIKNWLDSQPLKSVIFLCFGTNGCFSEPQLEQMAIALERSGHRFLWSIRKPPPKDTLGAPTEYTNLQDALPDGFIERVKGRGMVCGWAPQVEVLAHGAIKGFVSHCGWNSILESLVYGVPIATWPLAAEQQLNAFGLIEKAICSLMDDENPERERVKKISEKSRKVLENGGSSFVTLGKFVEDLLQNIC
ncbi:hypothetical protein CTI12_AA506830 [Artemisia annua]|uniref:Glycosyltransferase n=1 Tax=Artemisia annua TaxID=35608 RepID=A0A2U1LBN4_ARTAN|nr:hypothetical protein CTI12_AA506830 [Artemisia annua]